MSIINRTLISYVLAITFSDRSKEMGKNRRVRTRERTVITV